MLFLKKNLYLLLLPASSPWYQEQTGGKSCRLQGPPLTAISPAPWSPPKTLIPTYKLAGDMLEAQGRTVCPNPQRHDACSSHCPPQHGSSPGRLQAAAWLWEPSLSRPHHYTHGSLRSRQGLTLAVSPLCSDCRTRMPALTEQIPWITAGSNSLDPITFLSDLLLPPCALRDSLPLLQLWLSPPQWDCTSISFQMA